MNHLGEKAMKGVFLIAACASDLAVFLICVFLFANGLPAMGKIGPLKFLFGTEWRPTNDKFGILPMIVASIYVTAGAILTEYRSHFLHPCSWQDIVRKKSINH